MDYTDRLGSDRTRIAQRAAGAPNECWEATGPSTRRGYVFMWSSVEARQTYAHRIAWSVHHGRPIPQGMVIMHLCDNPPCVNPAHLRLGTQADNQSDMAAKGRGRTTPHPNPARGSAKVKSAKLTEADIPVICADPRTCEDIARDYGVRRENIGKIKRREAWKHVPVEVIVRHGRHPT